MNEVCGKLPEFKALDDSIAILSVQYGKKLLNGDDQAVASLKRRAGDSPQQKTETACVCRISRQIISIRYIPAGTAGIPVISADEKCHCFKQAIIDLLYDQSNIKELSADASFENFRLDFYPNILL